MSARGCCYPGAYVMSRGSHLKVGAGFSYLSHLVVNVPSDSCGIGPAAIATEDSGVNPHQPLEQLGIQALSFTLRAFPNTVLLGRHVIRREMA